MKSMNDAACTIKTQELFDEVREPELVELAMEELDHSPAFQQVVDFNDDLPF